jgi:uncharacterized protein (DUF58 family)
MTELSPADTLRMESEASIFYIPPVLILVAVFTFIAMVFRQIELSLFGVALIGSAVGLKWWSRAAARNLSCRIRLDRKKVFPLEDFSIEIHVKNNKALPVYFRTFLSVGKAIGESDRASADMDVDLGLLWHQQASYAKHFTARKRGVYKLKTAEAAVGDLFGIFIGTADIGQAEELVVFPRRIAIHPFPKVKRLIFGKPGVVSPLEDPTCFFGTRDYQHHRPARHIHWKASARYVRLQEKTFEPVGPDKVLLVLDTEPFVQTDAEKRMERAIECMAALSTMLDREKYGVGLFTNAATKRDSSRWISVTRKPNQLADILDALARIQFRPSISMPEILDRGLKIPTGTICVVFTMEELVIGNYFKQRHTAVVAVFCGTDDDAYLSLQRQSPGRCYRLQDFCFEEDEDEVR